MHIMLGPTKLKVAALQWLLRSNGKQVDSGFVTCQSLAKGYG
jgi:hypothetical protein